MLVSDFQKPLEFLPLDRPCAGENKIFFDQGPSAYLGRAVLESLPAGRDPKRYQFLQAGVLEYFKAL